MTGKMKTHIIAGSHREAQEWIWKQSKKDPFRSALRKANGIKLWDDYSYVARPADLMGHPKNTPLVYVGCFWESHVYKEAYDLLKTFDTPMPAPQKFMGVDIAAWANSLTTVGLSSGKTILSTQAMYQVLEGLKKYAETDVKLTMQCHDEFILEVKQ